MHLSHRISVGLHMYIRDIEIAPSLALAPMEGVTDIVFRRLIRQIGGCGLFCTEFIPARSLNADVPMALTMAQFDSDESPISIQIYGSDPDVMAEGARRVQDSGADILDLNMGCPSKAVCKNSGGSALMKDPALVRQIVKAMRSAVDMPFTAKMRAGWDHDHRNAVEIARICEGEGVEALSVHWRTRADRYGGDRDLGIIADVKNQVNVPVFANGDIIDAATAQHAFAATGCDGLMIGRGAIRNPWVFREIEAAMNGTMPPTINADEKERVLLGYYESLQGRFKNDRARLGRMKKIARYFTEPLPAGKKLRQSVFHSQTVEEAIDRIRAYFVWLREVESQG